MDISEIQKLISNGESKTIELKKSMAELEKFGKALSGMLNLKGGHGFIGITDAGKIIGIEATDSTKKKLTEFCNHFDPFPPLEIDYVKIPGSDKYVVTVTCSFAKEKGPYTFRGRAYLKTESGIKLMQSEKYRQLLLDNSGLSKAWESLPAPGYSINDLDHEEIIKTVRIGLKEGRVPTSEYTENVEEILTHFDLIQNGVLTNGAIALFAKKMPADYTQCFIRLGRFVDDSMDVLLDSQQVRGNAFQLFALAENFVQRHMPISSRFDPNKFERIDEIALPLMAVREAIVNSFCHRDYSRPEGDISLAIFHDALEIHNIGHLFGGLTIEELNRRHPSRRRNEKISQVFFTRALIDRCGGGITRIIALCAERGLPAPIYSDVVDGVMLRFPFKQSIGPNFISKPQKAKPKIRLKERELDILNLLANTESLSLKEIVELLKSPLGPSSLGNDLVNLRSLGLIDLEGIGRGSRWILVNKIKNGAENGAINGAENGAVIEEGIFEH